MQATVSYWTVEASYELDGQLLDCSQAEILGDAYRVRYASLADAQEAADDLQLDVADSDLDPSTTYSVREDAVQILHIAADPDGEGEGIATVTADVDGMPAVWIVEPRHCSDGIDGWELVSHDDDIVRRYGADLGERIGRAAVAYASLHRLGQ